MSLEDFEKLRGLNGPILVTGHTGFKGTWLTILLEQIGIEAYGLSLPAENGSMYERLDRVGKIPEKFADIRDQASTLKTISDFEPAAIIHLAAQPLVLNSYKYPVDTFSTNVMGTAHILDAASKVKSVKVVGVATTDKVYLNENLSKTFKEDSPLGGKDPYSASKVGAEQVIRAWQQIATIEKRPHVLSMRAGNVIGGGDFAKDRLLPDLIKAAFFNEPVTIRNPNSTRPWQHVLDPLFGYLLFLESALNGIEIPTLNFSPDESSLSVKEIVEIFSQKIPNARINIEEQKQNNLESKTLDLDSTLAMNKLNWRPRITQREAVISTVDWWLNCNDRSSIQDITKDQIMEFLGSKQ